jgi:hypothetical protein
VAGTCHWRSPTAGSFFCSCYLHDEQSMMLRSRSCNEVERNHAQALLENRRCPLVCVIGKHCDASPTPPLEVQPRRQGTQVNASDSRFCSRPISHDWHPNDGVS